MTEESSKWKRVDAEIRALIVSGEWRVGAQLPTYDELEERFKVSRITLQQVIRHLKQDGFITSLMRQGLFVSKTPPYLNRVGMVIPRDEHEVRYWKELVHCAQAVAQQLGQEVVLYRNMEKAPDTERQLRYDLHHHLLAGVFFPYSIPAGEPGYEVFTDPLAPKVAPLKTAAETPAGSERTLYYHLNETRLIERALDYLQQQGCSRIALISNVGPSGIPPAFDAEIKRRRLFSPPEWQFMIALPNLDIAEKIATLLMRLPGKERPDGIFISDDNFALPVIKGIAATRFRVPEDIAIVSHYNWSVGAQDQLPVKSLGFNLKSLLFKVFDAFRRYHETGILPNRLVELPVFEEELQDGCHESAC